MFANLDSQLFILQPTVHRYLPHMQAEQQQAVACTRHIRASVEKKDLRKPEFPVPRKWLVGERSDNVVTAQMGWLFALRFSVWQQNNLRLLCFLCLLTERGRLQR